MSEANSEFDPYLILGVSTSATQEDIVQAYRRLAATMHPDLNLGDPRATWRFQQVQRAYELLSGPQTWHGGSSQSEAMDCPICTQKFVIEPAALQCVFNCPHCGSQLVMPGTVQSASQFTPPPPPPAEMFGGMKYQEAAADTEVVAPEWDPNDPRYHYRRSKRNRDLGDMWWIPWPLRFLMWIANMLRP